jgi:hypothetical protein
MEKAPNTPIEPISQYALGTRARINNEPLDLTQEERWQVGWQDANSYLRVVNGPRKKRLDPRNASHSPADTE